MVAILIRLTPLHIIYTLFKNSTQKLNYCFLYKLTKQKPLK